MSDIKDPKNWKYSSPESEGLHEIVSPENSACEITWIYRLNLSKGNTFELFKEELEMNSALIKGSIKASHNNNTTELKKLDSFYLPAKESLKITALEDSILFIGASFYDGKGRYFTRKFDAKLPLGKIRQVHGEAPYRRDVFMTIAQEDEGSRLICGITSGDAGKWTSWPPHQHTKDLEEVYCFFDIPEPQKAFHYSSRVSGKFEYIHPVSTGDCVIVPEGYHPTCGMPGVKSCYFWVMAAHKATSRRYDLAINDPHYDGDHISKAK